MEESKYLVDYIVVEEEIKKLESELIQWEHKARNELITLTNSQKRKHEQTKISVARLNARKRLMLQLLRL